MGLPYNFIIIAGGRGIGKTYGALIEVKEHPEWNSLYLRSMQKEHEMIRKPKYSPFAWHNKDFGWNVQPFKEDKVASIWCDAILNEEKGVYEPASEPYMTSMALYDIASIRGFNGADIQWIIYDEFNPQKGMIFRINDDDFPNCYETVNRNRELQGEPGDLTCDGVSLVNSLSRAMLANFVPDVALYRAVFRLSFPISVSGRTISSIPRICRKRCCVRKLRSGNKIQKIFY